MIVRIFSGRNVTLAGVGSTKSPIIYAFIDSQNLNLGVRSAGWTLDFQKFSIYLREKLKVSKSFLFIGYISQQENLYRFLQECGYTVIFKQTQIRIQRGKQIIKGNVDAELVLHAMIEWEHYDKAIIISGDGDFYCLINHLRSYHKLEKILVPNQKYSSLLKEFASMVVLIDQLRDKVEKRP